ncbi:MAG: Gfo/Idh/MocA family oxidoreductase [Alphaproteobacteria bacterium]|nr:Gfo/Idh/MocA family oxidoreductase [Alphaproteobacteria bacterium]
MAIARGAAHQDGAWTVAVVGCGIGRGHIEGYKAHPDKFRVTALCDVDEGRLAATGDEFAITRRTVSFDDILRLADIDIVDICTPPALHVTQALAVLVAGKEVVCEKPVAGSLADIDRVIAAEGEAAGRVMPVFQYRFGDGVRKAKHVIDLGLAGTSYLATVETAWRRTPEYYRTMWRGRLQSELGGVLLTHAIHSHDLLTYLMGPVASVFAHTATRINPVEVEDCAVASLVMQSGALASLAATLGSHREISRLRLCFEQVTFESSLAPYSPGDDPWSIIPASPTANDRIGNALAGYRSAQSGFAGLMGAYHEALTTGGALPVTLADARQSLELVTALYHSAATGSLVDLPIGRDHPRYSGWQAA